MRGVNLHKTVRVKALVSSGLSKMAFMVTCDVGTLQERYAITRAVSVNALIYAINAAAINAIKYFN